MSFQKCESCQVKLPAGKCIFATYRKVINGREYIFCCKLCADRFEEKVRS